MVWIPDDGQIPMLHRQCMGQNVLCVVRILIFIDQDVLKFLLKLLENLRMIAKHIRRPQQQIIKIEGIILLQELLVIAVHPGDALALKIVRAGRERLRRDQLILGIADLRMNQRHRKIRRAQVGRLDRFLQCPLLIGGVINRKIPRQTDLIRIVPQNPQTERMEGANNRASLIQSPEIPQLLLHLP